MRSREGHVCSNSSCWHSFRLNRIHDTSARIHSGLGFAFRAFDRRHPGSALLPVGCANWCCLGCLLLAVSSEDYHSYHFRWASQVLVVIYASLLLLHELRVGAGAKPLLASDQPSKSSCLGPLRSCYCTAVQGPQRTAKIAVLYS